MSNFTSYLAEEFINLQGKPADYVTNYLKSWGGDENGTMAKGLLNILTITEMEKLESVAQARVGSIAIGTISTAIIVGGIHLFLKHQEKKQSRKKMQEVAEILKQEVALANQEELPVDENEVIEKA